MIGSTPVTWMSKCQVAVATSTYSAEVCAMRVTTEEAVYNLVYACSLSISVYEPTKIFGDNLGVIQNASMPEATLQKKHTTISFHTKVRECVAAKISEPHKIEGKDNVADIFTKTVDVTTFKYHAWDLMWNTPTSQ